MTTVLSPYSSMVECSDISEGRRFKPYYGNSPTSVGTGWFRVSEISMVTCIKRFLECTKTATVEIQFNGKHTGFIPNLLFKGDCWRIWLGRCHVKGTVATQKCGDNPCIVDASSARISVGYIAISTS